VKELLEDKDIQYLPNQKWHRNVSLVKSGIRILGYWLIVVDPLYAVISLIVSEAVGIIEELV
jgi:hypothetical protein